MSRALHLFEFPSNLGLKQLTDKQPGVWQLPDWLRKAGLHDTLRPAIVSRLPAPAYAADAELVSGIRHAEAIGWYARQQAALLTPSIAANAFCLVLGGDCSILIGNALALKNTGRCALFFVDGHTDFVRPEQSATGGAAGMDLALVTGHGPLLLTDMEGHGPYFEEQMAWCIGNRYFDEGYLQPLLESKITYLDLHATRHMGCGECAGAFLRFLDAAEAPRFFVHLDVDVLDNQLMPAVDSPQPGGFSYEELGALLYPLLSDARCAGMEITILDPDLDPGLHYTLPFTEWLCSLLRRSGI